MKHYLVLCVLWPLYQLHLSLLSLSGKNVLNDLVEYIAHGHTGSRFFEGANMKLQHTEAWDLSPSAVQTWSE